MDKSTVISKDGKEFHFSFNPETEDPREGATLTGIYENGRRLRPSDFGDDEIPYDEADKVLIRTSVLGSWARRTYKTS